MQVFGAESLSVGGRLEAAVGLRRNVYPTLRSLYRKMREVAKEQGIALTDDYPSFQRTYARHRKGTVTIGQCYLDLYCETLRITRAYLDGKERLEDQEKLASGRRELGPDEIAIKLASLQKVDDWFMRGFLGERRFEVWDATGREDTCYWFESNSVDPELAERLRRM